MVEIECLLCGEVINIPEYIDTDDYDGQVACSRCKSLLHVKLLGSKVNKYKVVKKGLMRLTAYEYYQIKNKVEELKRFEDEIRGQNA